MTRKEQEQTVFAGRRTFLQTMEAIADIRKRGNKMLAEHLEYLVSKAVETPMTRKHFHFWKREWQRTDAKLEDACQLLEGFATFFDLSTGLAITAGPIDRSLMVFDAMLEKAAADLFGGIRELLRLVAQELQTHQHFVFAFQGRPEPAKTALRTRYLDRVAQRLQERFRDGLLTRALATCRASNIARDPATAFLAVGEPNFEEWLNTIGAVRELPPFFILFSLSIARQHPWALLYTLRDECQEREADK